MSRDRILDALRDAVITMLAALATMFCALAIDPEPGAAVIGVVLCLSLARSHLDRDWRGRIEAAIALPALSLGALGVGWLLHEEPRLGACAFVAAVSLSIWLRRFGHRGRQIGGLIALPFVVLLVTPHVRASPAGHAPALAMPVIVAWLALLWVSTFDAIGARLVPRHSREPDQRILTAAAVPTSGLRPSASTRMAVQMAVALGVAFVVGYRIFAAHWAWVVLTAFIVNSGNHGRADVVYKSLLRVLGAGVGTAVVLAVDATLGSTATLTMPCALAAVFLAVWLRPLGYAWWALFITLALAWLQGYASPSMREELPLRLTEIVVGAVIGVAAAWFVWPVRSTDVLRRRMSEALAALAEAVDPSTPARAPATFKWHLSRIEKIAPAFRAARLATRPWRNEHPADWIDELLSLRGPACALIAQGAAPGGVRKAIGGARHALREPIRLRSALADLRASLADAANTPCHASEKKAVS